MQGNGSAFQFKGSIFNGRVKGYMKKPWEYQCGGVLHIFLECCKIGILLIENSLVRGCGHVQCFQSFQVLES